MPSCWNDRFGFVEDIGRRRRFRRQRGTRLGGAVRRGQGDGRGAGSCALWAGIRAEAPGMLTATPRVCRWRRAPARRTGVSLGRAERAACEESRTSGGRGHGVHARVAGWFCWPRPCGVFNRSYAGRILFRHGPLFIIPPHAWNPTNSHSTTSRPRTGHGLCGLNGRFARTVFTGRAWRRRWNLRSGEGAGERCAIAKQVSQRGAAVLRSDVARSGAEGEEHGSDREEGDGTRRRASRRCSADERWWRSRSELLTKRDKWAAVARRRRTVAGPIGCRGCGAAWLRIFCAGRIKYEPDARASLQPGGGGCERRSRTLREPAAQGAGARRCPRRLHAGGG